MIDEPLWIDLESLVLMQGQQIERFGGAHGVRDQGVIESALYRVKNRFYYDREAVDFADLAAAYLFGFTRSQGFVDGNKRIALASALVFLKVNGHPLHVPPRDLYVLTMAVADESIRMAESDVAVWLRSRLESESSES